MRKGVLSLIFFASVLLLSSGCGTMYKVAVDERSLSTQVEDEEITMAIRKKFFDDATVKYLDISTYCYHGDVYLVGEYEDIKQREQAVNLARGVQGVKSVSSYFLPKRSTDDCGKGENLKLMAKIKAKLIKDRDIWSTNIEVKTLQCRAVLLGLVGSEKEIRKAIAHARNVTGVKGVKSFLRPIE
ncbi:MAG: BON domain-containing protein [Deltaproteobacteria bacterium]|nr:BON domain-containing protein [Deltaproteobacteria bacterium]MBW2137317.1 BON domain-containing protein [Deltaproteobacteria bacterium]